MPSIHQPDVKQLSKFAFTIGAAFALVFGLALPWLWGTRYPAWPWVVLMVVGLWAVTSPASLAPVYRAWMRAAEVIGVVNNRIVLGIVFFALILPFGVVRRTFGRDAMQRRFAPTAKSYRIPKAPIKRGGMERPF